MKIDTNVSNRDRLTRSAFWVSTAFYGLVAFEFFYMVSPFATYFYAVYGPGLGAIGDSPTAHWLISFFLPHIVAQTSSFFVDSHNIVGALLMMAGLSGFVIGAYQIYSNKLRKGGAVEGGIYRWIRHPQYLALMMASLGMLLLWPRFLVLFGFITVLFIYTLLARVEERLCLRQFSGYAEYVKRTGMFLPRMFETPVRSLPIPSSTFLRILMWAFLYLAAMVLAAGVGIAVKSHAINNLYAYYTKNAAYISVGQLQSREIEEIAMIANADPRIKAALEKIEGESPRFINYVLPTRFYISEIPMHLPAGVRTGHIFPHDHDVNAYKVIFTLAQFGTSDAPESVHIVEKALNKTPIIEAWVDRQSARVVRVHAAPVRPFYNNMPVPLF